MVASKLVSGETLRERPIVHLRRRPLYRVRATVRDDGDMVGKIGEEDRERMETALAEVGVAGGAGRHHETNVGRQGWGVAQRRISSSGEQRMDKRANG